MIRDHQLPERERFLLAFYASQLSNITVKAEYPDKVTKRASHWKNRFNNESSVYNFQNLELLVQHLEICASHQRASEDDLKVRHGAQQSTLIPASSIPDSDKEKLRSLVAFLEDSDTQAFISQCSCAEHDYSCTTITGATEIFLTQDSLRAELQRKEKIKDPSDRVRDHLHTLRASLEQSCYSRLMERFFSKRQSAQLPTANLFCHLDQLPTPEFFRLLIKKAIAENDHRFGDYEVAELSILWAKPGTKPQPVHADTPDWHTTADSEEYVITFLLSDSHPGTSYFDMKGLPTHVDVNILSKAQLEEDNFLHDAPDEFWELVGKNSEASQLVENYGRLFLTKNEATRRKDTTTMETFSIQ